MERRTLWFAAAVAASAGYIAHRASQGNVRDARGVRELYDRLAPAYDVTALVFRPLGARRLQERAVDLLDLRSGDTVVDSGYLAMMADVGIIGLALLLILFVRLLRRAWDLGRRGAARGWGTAGVLVVIMLDATSRESLTGFPTAYVGMLLVGLGLAITAEESDGGSPAADAG